jgi:hypothetical protein
MLICQALPSTVPFFGTLTDGTDHLWIPFGSLIRSKKGFRSLPAPQLLQPNPVWFLATIRVTMYSFPSFHFTIFPVVLLKLKYPELQIG